MKFPLEESEKNFFVCAAMMILVGVSFIAFMGKVEYGIVSIVAGAAFGIGGLYMNIKREPDDENTVETRKKMAAEKALLKQKKNDETEEVEETEVEETEVEEKED